MVQPHTGESIFQLIPTPSEDETYLFESANEILYRKREGSNSECSAYVELVSETSDTSVLNMKIFSGEELSCCINGIRLKRVPLSYFTAMLPRSLEMTTAEWIDQSAGGPVSSLCGYEDFKDEVASFMHGSVKEYELTDYRSSISAIEKLGLYYFLQYLKCPFCLVPQQRRLHLVPDCGDPLMGGSVPIYPESHSVAPLMGVGMR